MKKVFFIVVMVVVVSISSNLFAGIKVVSNSEKLARNIWAYVHENGRNDGGHISPELKIKVKGIALKIDGDWILINAIARVIGNNTQELEYYYELVINHDYSHDFYTEFHDYGCDGLAYGERDFVASISADYRIFAYTSFSKSYSEQNEKQAREEYHKLLEQIMERIGEKNGK